MKENSLCPISIYIKDGIIDIIYWWSSAKNLACPCCVRRHWRHLEASWQSRDPRSGPRAPGRPCPRTGAIIPRKITPIPPGIAAIWTPRRQRSRTVAPGRPRGTRGTRGNGIKAWRPGATARRQGAKNSLLMVLPSQLCIWEHTVTISRMKSLLNNSPSCWNREID